MKYTEMSCQLAVYNYRHRIKLYPTILTNIYYFGWESDVLYISPSGHLYEWEIKLSKSDFRADGIKVLKHQKLAAMEPGKGPSEFYYLSPPGIIKVEEIPSYAGLAWVFRDTIEIKKPAPRKRGKVVKDKEWAVFASKAVERYWTLRKHYWDKAGIKII